MLWMMQGNLADTRQWAARRGLDKDINPAEMDQRDDYINYHLRKYEYAVAVRLWLAEGRANEALALLDQAMPRVEKWKRPALEIELYSLRALALQALGQPELAFGALEHALELAEPEGYMRLFVDEGRPMYSLLAAYSAAPQRGRPALKAYTERLLAAFGPPAAAPEPADHDAPLPPSLVEPLSDREQAVLRLLASSLSAAEIAEELCIAVSTVRSHTKAIYGKLGVSGRLQAVEQAKTLGLL
jgi:LuxR family maltose regulon positive regulatory protein